MFSKACKYAIKATILIALKTDATNSVSISYIAEAINTPKAYTSKILQTLVKNKILESTKGMGGGFKIKVEALDDMKLIDIVRAIDGIDFFNRCGLGFHICNDLCPCFIHNQYSSTREKLKSISETTSIRELLINIEQGKSVLKL